MATHSSILAWEIPWTEEPGRLQFMGVTKETKKQLHCLTRKRVRTISLETYQGCRHRFQSVEQFYPFFTGFFLVTPNILTWKIPWTEEPGGLQSMGPQKVKDD